MGSLMRAHDWSASPLGEPGDWPQVLKTLVSVMLGSGQPMFTAWGPERTMLYNDGYAELCRDRHPAALGRPFREVWHDIMGDVGPILERAFTGEPTHMDDIQFMLLRDGRPQEAHFAFSYTPVRDETGAVAGMFCACQEVTDKVLADRRLSAERDRLMGLFENAPSFICTTQGPDHVFDYINTAHRRLFDSEGWLGKPVREALPEFAGQGYFELLDEVYSQGASRTLRGAPVAVGGRDGLPLRQYFLDFVYQPIRDPAGRVTGIFCEGYDVSDRLIAEAAVEDGRHELEVMADALPVLISYVDRDRRYRFVNKGYETWFSLNRDQLIGRRVDEVIGEAAYAAVKPRIDGVLAGERLTFEAVMPYPGGARDIRVEYVPRRGATGAVEGFYALVQDISEAKRNEAALRESEARFRNVADHAPVMIWVTDPDGACTYLNRQWYDFTGQTVEEALGLGWLSAVHPDDADEAGRVFLTANARCEPFRLEYRLRRFDGGYRWAIDAAAPRFGADGEFMGFVGSVVDIHDVRSVQDALTASEARLRFLNDLAAATSGSTDADEILAVTCRMVAEHLKLSDCAYADMDEDQDGFTIRDDWAAPGSPSIVGHYKLADFGRLAVQELSAGRPLIVNNNLEELAPEEAATFQAIGITATVCMPLVKDGRLRALMAIHDREARVWTDYEKALIAEVTERSWAHVERVSAEADLRDSEARLRLAIDAGQLAEVVFDLTDDSVRHGAAFARLLGHAEDRRLTLDELRSQYHPEDLARVVEERRQILETGQSFYEVQHRITRPDGQVRWLLGRGRVTRDGDGEPVSVTAIYMDETDRRRAEEALKASEERLRMAAHAADMGAWDFDLVRDRGMTDEAALRVFGFPPDFPRVFKSEGWMALVHADDRPAVEEAFNAAREPGGPAYMAEFRTAHPAPDGGERWLASHGAMIRDDGGRAVRAVGVIRDVTHRRRADAELRASEARFRALADAMPQLVWTAHADGRVDYYNARRAEYRGLEERAGEYDWAPLVHEDDRAATHAAWEEAHRSGEPYTCEHRLRRADGTWAWHVSRAVPERDRDGRAIRWYGTATDIHALKSAQEAAEASNARLEERIAEALAERKLLADLVENTDAFVQVADMDLNWLAINRAAADEFERIFGIRPKIGDNMLKLLEGQPEHRAGVEAIWRRALAEDAFTEMDEFGDPSLDRRYYEMRFRPLVDAKGRRIGAYQFVYDVTDRLGEQARLAQAEEALRQGQKMQAVGQLAGGIAHDFNNLLGAIVGSLDLVRRRGSLDDRSRRFVDNAFTAAERGAKLTSQLLAFARAQKLELKPIYVSGVLDGMRDMLTRTLGPQIELEVINEVERIPVLTDPTQLEMAILNLAINARDAMPDGGRLTLRKRLLEIESDPELAPGEYIELAVSDSGAGMPADVVARAFDPFFTTKGVGQGTGLGLSQVYGIARQAGGTARIESAPGKGTTVRLFLRRTELPVAEALAEAEDGGGGQARSARVLVVDDDPELRRFLADSLDTLGYQVEEAADGAAGLEAMEAAAPDLVILDYAMPGMTGAEVARQVREQRPDLPIVFVSGYADTAAIEAVMGADARILRKPFRLHELQAMLADALG